MKENALQVSMTVGELRRATIAKLRAAGVESAELAAHMLICFALKLDGAALVADPRRPVLLEQQDLVDRWVARRIAGEPVARIIGSKEFWSRPFRMGPDTLVPRPETETLVEAALDLFPDSDMPFRVLDLGTGSGILLTAILLERPHATGIGIDRSEAALAIARDNLNTLGVGDRAQLVCADWGGALSGTFDLVVCNPPYISSSELSHLSREVCLYDPRLALDGGIDGLVAYRKIIAELPYLLSKQGVAVFELGIGLEQSVAALALTKGLLVKGPARRDLGNIARALIVYPPIQK